MLQSAAAGEQPFALEVSGIAHSETYTKTLFITFRDDTRLSGLSRRLCDLHSNGAAYALQPHLSLAYKHLDALRRESVAHELVPPFHRIIFDEVTAVLCPRRIAAAEDVYAWRVIARLTLKP